MKYTKHVYYYVKWTYSLYELRKGIEKIRIGIYIYLYLFIRCVIVTLPTKLKRARRNALVLKFDLWVWFGFSMTVETRAYTINFNISPDIKINNLPKGCAESQSAECRKSFRFHFSFWNASCDFYFPISIRSCKLCWNCQGVEELLFGWHVAVLAFWQLKILKHYCLKAKRYWEFGTNLDVKNALATSGTFAISCSLSRGRKMYENIRCVIF